MNKWIKENNPLLNYNSQAVTKQQIGKKFCGNLYMLPIALSEDIYKTIINDLS